MSAPEAIRTLHGLYTEAMDAAAWSAVGELFARGRLTGPDGATVAEGAAGVQGLYSSMVRLHDGSPRTRHVTANAVIEVDGDTATSRSAFVVHQQLEGLPLQAICAGRYLDRFACTDGAWHFVERQFFLDQVGDLSGHLA